MASLSRRIAEELSVRDVQVDAAVALLDGGNTVPFIARYRKEATGGLDDTQLRTLEERLGYLRELDERRDTILKSLTEQDKLTDTLRQQLEMADTKARLEDLYLPYKPRRRTKAQIAREAGLEPLADRLLADPTLDPETTAEAFVDTENNVADTKAALTGARDILVERFAEDADLVGVLRDHLWENGALVSRVVEGKEADGAKFSDYFDYREPLARVPSHRALALLRGRNEEMLTLNLEVPGAEEAAEKGELHPCELRIANRFEIVPQGRPADGWLRQVVGWTWRVKLALKLELELLNRLREAAGEEAIRVFATNLRDLLMAAPAGSRVTLGLDPGFRTGVKAAIVDGTGKMLDTATLYPHEPQRRWDEALATLGSLVKRHQVALIAIGNGTASRETDRLVADFLKRASPSSVTKVMVSEAGASVYSASEFAAREFPDLDVSLRGAVSIARRLQDPLAELVKIEPKAIGVGQYQHDVNQVRLARALDGVVEDCVNSVGVDVNTASVPLLSRVAGIGPTLATNLVQHRDANGRFRTRKDILGVPRLGPKAFEQCAGFLRILDGQHPLDASAVHPEAYPLVDRLLKTTGREIRAVMGDVKLLRTIDAESLTDERFGLPTVRDILAELEKPGRDPRPVFKVASFRDGIEQISDLKSGMTLEGVVTNVTNFGAFVDVGVHQDGLVHVSQLADRFVKDPRDVVKAGDVVSVRVVEVDLARRRIALSMRKDGGDAAQGSAAGRPGPERTTKKGRMSGGGGRSGQNDARRTGSSPTGGAGDEAGSALAAAFAKARQRQEKGGR